MIYGDRLRQARELAGLTQRDLAVVAGVPQPRISNAERQGEPLPGAATAEIAAHTGFPVSFFESPPALQFATEPVHFRAQASVRAAQMKQAKRAGEIIGEQAIRMRTTLRLPRLRLRAVGISDPATAAAAIRQQLQLSESEPVASLPLLLEHAGLLVLGLPLPAFKRDAFSIWVDDLPLLALLNTEAGDRQAWSTAHELGHLVMHRGAAQHRDLEAQADEFAMHFLLPLHAIAKELPELPTLQHFALLKRRWGVSIQALVRTARRLDAIDQDRYTSLFRQISARGERLRERAAIAPVKPRGFRKMAETLYGPAPAAGLAREAEWTASYAELVLAQHASAQELPLVRRLPPASNVTSLQGRRRDRLTVLSGKNQEPTTEQQSDSVRETGST